MTSNKKLFKVNNTNTEIINQYLEYHTSKKPDLSHKSINNIKKTIKKLADHLKQKSLKEAKEENLMQFFKTIENPKSRETYAVHIIPFYRWIHDTPKPNRPPNMTWFEYPSQRTKRKFKDPKLKEKLLITPKEYQQMIDYSNDIYGQNKALWETYYLTGIRPSEMPSIKLEHITNKNNVTLITIPESKTQPRTIPFPETPYKLLEYLKQHPNKDNPNTSLFFSFKSANKLEPIHIDSIRLRFLKMKKDLKNKGFKQTLMLKSFRKTRTSIVFYQNKLTDKDIGKIFGWTPNTVIHRRDEYELSNIDDLIKKYCSKQPQSIPSYTTLKEQTQTDIQQLQKENDILKQQMINLQEGIKFITETIQNLPKNKTLNKITPEETLKAMWQTTDLNELTPEQQEHAKKIFKKLKQQK